MGRSWYPSAKDSRGFIIGQKSQTRATLHINVIDALAIISRYYPKLQYGDDAMRYHW